MEGLGSVQLIANVILAAMWVTFYEVTLERRFRLPVMITLWTAATALWFTLVYLFPFGTAARVLVGPVIFFIVPLFAYKSRWIRCIFSVGLSMVIMLASEVLMAVLFPQLRTLTAGTGGVGEIAVQTQIAMYLLYLPLNAILLMLAAILFRRYRSRLSAREWLLYALFPFSQMLLCLTWYMLWLGGDTADALVWQGVALIVCAAADIALYFAMRGMAQRAQLKAEKELLEKQIDAQKEHYSALTEQYENVRRMRHDIANHVHTIQILLEKGENAEAAAYAAELRPQTAFKSSLGQCENPVADAFLYSRITELRGQGVDVTAEVTLPAYTGIANADLIIAFGNLLDNASEACAALKEKRLAIRARAVKGYLTIETKNPLPADAGNSKKHRIPELERGVGFHILKELAERYDGAFTYRASDGVFRAELTLKEAAADAANSDM